MPLPYRRGAERIIKYLTGKYQLGGVFPDSDGFFTGVPKNIVSRTDTVNNTGAGPDVLHTYTIPANTFRKSGDFIDFWFGGGFASNDNDKTIDSQFDGTSFEGTGSRDFDLGAWLIAGRVQAIDLTNVLISSFIIVNSFSIDSTAAILTSFNEGHFSSARNKTQGVANLSTNSMVIRCRGSSAAAAASDVFQRNSIINVTRL